MVIKIVAITLGIFSPRPPPKPKSYAPSTVGAGRLECDLSTETVVALLLTCNRSTAIATGRRSQYGYVELSIVN
jgi:hypothetical protein